MNKILIIEDEEDLRMTILDILSFSGYEVISADNGKDGVLLGYKEKPDLIICDIMMPAMSGFEVLKMIQQNKELIHVPFIFLTAKTEKQDIREGMNLGADDYITKPFSMDELLEAVSVRIRKSLEIKGDIKDRINNLIQELNRTSFHEFNTPLNGIIGFSDLILSMNGKITPEKLIKIAGHISISGKRLKHMTDIILIYKQLIAFEHNPKIRNNFIFQKSKINVEEMHKLINSVVTRYNREKDVCVDVEECELNISGSFFEFMIEELLENACKFSLPDEKIKITGNLKDNKYILQVSDEGYGMTKENINHIGPFRQFNKSSYEQNGNGLGLYIIKKIIEMNNGKFIVTSELEKGTCIEIILFGVKL